MNFKSKLSIGLSGMGLLKGKIGAANKSFSISASDYRGGSSGLWMFNGGLDGRDMHFNYENINSSLKAYADCPPVNAIINLKAQAFMNGKTLLTNSMGKAKGKPATGELATKINTLLTRPNPIQSWAIFETQNYIFQQVAGYCVVVPIKPAGFPNSYATALWNVPPWMLGIIEKPNTNLLTARSYKDFIDSIFIVWGGLTIPLNLDDIYIFKDFTPSSFSMAFPESRIRALRQPINNIIGAYDSRNVLINRRGALGVLSNDGKDVNGTIPLDPDEKKSLQDDYRKFGLRSNQWNVIVTNAMLKWQQMGFPTKDLMLFEEIQDDIQRVCDSYGYPYRLLASEKAASYNDVKVFGKKLYQDTTMPESELIYSQWNEFFELGKNGLLLTKDFKHVAALQEDQVNEARARLFRNQGALIEFQNNLITLNQWCDLNNNEPVSSDIGDLYYFELLAKGIQFGSGASGSSNPDIASGNSSADQNSGGSQQ